MEKYLEMYARNQEIVGPEIIKYNGEEIVVPGMDEVELEEFIEEGEAIGNIEIEILSGDNQTIKLIDMADGRKLFKRLESMNLSKDSNMTAFWYVWREARMKERMEKLPEARREQILAIIESQ